MTAQPQPVPETPQQAARRLSAPTLQKGYLPKALHEYQDSKGNPLYWRIRCEHLDGKKWIRPMRLNGNGYELGEPEYTVKPLYRLAEIASNTEATVWVVEGEKCVDALSRLGVIATTSGASSSAGKADWTPLAKREVIIWPDNDKDGLLYGKDVKDKLEELGTNVRLVDIAAIGLPEKGDVVDWLEKNPNASKDDVENLAIVSTMSVLSVQEWPVPEEIKEELLPVEVLPEGIIPEPFQDWLSDASYRMSCPIDFVATAAIVMAGTVIGAGCGIKPKCKDDWLVVPNLWGGVVARPSMLKTPALNEAMKPLSRMESQAKEQFDDDARIHEAKAEMFKAEQNALKLDMKKIAEGKSKDGSLRIDDIKNQYAKLEAPKSPVWQRYKTNDATIEKIGELLADNPRGLLIFRDELIGLLASWDKSGHESDRAFYLEAWNGYGSITTDRIGRGTIHTDNLCVSVFGGIQPTKLFSYLLQALRGIENDGLIQRLQLLVYPDEPKKWKLVDQYPNTVAKNRAFEIIKKLSTMDFTQHGATQNEGDQFPWYRFEDEAQNLFNEWLTELQLEKLQPEDDPIMMEHLGKYRSLMPSLALIFHLIDIADGKANGSVSVAAAARAAAWCEYLESHARRIYGMVSNIAIRSASMLAEKIRKGIVQDGFTVRDIYRKNWHLLNDKDLAQAACHELVEAGWLREEITSTEFRYKGKTTYLINPKVKKS